MAAALSTCWVFSGCSSGGSGTGHAETLQSIGFRDQGAAGRGQLANLDAAVRFAAGRHSLAVTSISDIDDTRLYELLSIRDEPCWVRVDGLAGLRAGPMGEVTVRCRIGRFGDPGREAQFERAIAARLADKAAGG